MSAVHCLINIVMIIVLSLLISMWWQESLLLEQDVQETESNGEGTKVSSTQNLDGVRSVDSGKVEQKENHEESSNENVINSVEGSTAVRDDSSNVSSNTSSNNISNNSNNNISNSNDVSNNISNNINSSAGNINKIDNALNNIDNSSNNGNTVNSANKNCFCSCNDIKNCDPSGGGSCNQDVHQKSLTNGETSKDSHLADNIGSSVVCFGSNHFDRQCYFNNLYYLPLVNEFAFLHTANSEIIGVPRDRFNPTLLDLSTVADHNAQYFNYIDLAVNETDPIYKNLTEASVIDQPCLIMRRFNPDNLMHIFHDDLLPIYQTIKTWNKTSRFMNEGKSNKQVLLNEPASLRLVFIEGWDPGLYGELYEIFSENKNYKPLYIEKDIRGAGKIVRFRNAVIGLSKHTIWYQYGFTKPQGPIENSLVTGYDIRSFASYVQDSLVKISVNSFHDTSLELCDNTFSMISTGDQYQQQTCSVQKESDLLFRVNGESKDGVIKQHRNTAKVNLNKEEMGSIKRIAVLLKRQSTRLILNELELSLALAQKLSVRVIVLSLETHNIREIVQAVSTCHVLIGMHGSLLIMSIFLPPGAQVIELFPFAINPSRYTPYRTLALLRGMNIHYLSWRNKDKSMSKAHPDRTPDLGGIAHLSENEQRDIEETEEVGEHLCCSDPNWLYHINQDTRVNVRDIVDLALASISKQQISHPVINTKYQIFPSRVINITCHFNEQDKVLLINWMPPVNLPYIESNQTVSYELWLQPIGSETGGYSAWILKHTSHVFTVETQDTSSEDSLAFGSEYNVWVRCLVDEGRTVGPFISPSSPCRTF